MKYADKSEINDAIQIAAGDSYYKNIASNITIIKNDGTVWVSGKNDDGQIGNNTNISTTYLTLMGDGFLNYPDKFIEIGINDTYSINADNLNIEDDMNVFIDSTSTLGTLSYSVEDTNIAEIESDNVIKGISQGITKVLVTDNKTGAKTYIWVKVVEDKKCCNKCWI